MAKSEDFIPKDLATALADAVAKGIKQGAKKGFSAENFLGDLQDQMDKFAKDQQAYIINEKVKQRALDKTLDIREIELDVMKEMAIEENKNLIAKLKANVLLLERKKIYAELKNDMAAYYKAEEAISSSRSDIEALYEENNIIVKTTEERKKQLKLQKEQEERQKVEEEAAERLKKIDHERAELMESINEKAHIFKQALTDGRLRMALLTAGAMKLGEAFSEAYTELKAEGLSVTQAAHEAMSSFTDSMSTGFLISAESIREARKGIMDTGGSLHDAEEAGKAAAQMAERFGGSAQQAGKAIGNLSKLPGLTKEAANNAAEFGAKLSMAADVPADTVTKALAENMDAAAKAGPNMTKSFAQAAVNAKKIGVEFSTVTGMAEKLLDFENSINAQMEASVLLGKELNLDKAREAALAGDYATVQKEILKQVGSEAEFTKMNVLQKQKLAEAMGVSVGDLAKMVKGQGELADGTKLEEANRAESAGFMADIYNFGAKHAGSLAAMVPSLLQMVLQLKMMKALQGGEGGLFSGLFGKKGSKMPELPETDALADSGKKMSGVGKEGMLDKLQKIDAKQMLSTAAAIAAVGVALLGVGLGIKFASEGLAELVQSFKGLTGTEMLGALGALLIVMGGFAAMVYVLATASTVAALPLLALGAAFLMIGGGIAIAALGIGYMVKQLGEIPYENLMALPGAMLGIGAGLYMMGAAGAIAIPTILALIALAAVAPQLAVLGTALGALSIGGNANNTEKEEEGTTLKDVKDAILELATAITTKKGDVTIDGKTIGHVLAPIISREINYTGR